MTRRSLFMTLFTIRRFFFMTRRSLPRIRRSLLLSLALAPSLGAEDIQCPDSARPVGAAPPAGRELRCELPDGTPHGPWLTWYEDGQPMTRRTLREGEEHGLQESWWPNGQRMMRGISVHGNRFQGFEYWDPQGEPVAPEQLGVERPASGGGE